ncbi:pyridoxamine 5'-phosphate oxidase family protein [Paenibacillus beijingensis]|uniref:Flavin-nucleotide-binding protein n=1 Tax=Paenibacillus beijingensis TaxID=1126833 RepID=A0A0D5NEQ3_9BACL|nr:pyridoxamine 5'-phosphate oxidase family protein [Paenibacillus beijingensis]AJY73615.1 flavin-nucleotide-binding protein [Paenibacillus beijingensis]
MRREEFDETENEAEVESFLNEMSFGFLGTVLEDGSPGVTPLNYVYLNGNIYVHGSRAGEKMRTLKKEDRVTFCVAKEYAVIPSYFSDPVMACPATTYFKSVVLKGTASQLEESEEKAAALEALMQKLQPEGGYKTITAGDPDYVPRLKGVAVIRIKVDQMSAKFKFGQNLAADKRRSLTDQLERRGCPFDHETASLMNRYAPPDN